MLIPLSANARQGQDPSNPAKELVQERRTDVQNLPQQARSRIQSLSNLAVHKRVHPVRLPEWLHDEEKLTIYVNRNSREIRFSPGEGGEELHIIRSGIEVISDSAYAWAGDVYFSSGANPIDDAVFIQDKEGEITGNIDVKGLFFQVHPLGASGLHAIVEFDEEEMAGQSEASMRSASPYHHGGAAAPETVLPNQQDSPAWEEEPVETGIEEIPEHLLMAKELEGEEDFPGSCSMRYIRALVLYTQGADAYGNINNIIDLAIQETNQAYVNSGIGANQSVVLQHKVLFNFDETINIRNDIQQLIAHPTAQSLRTQHNADVVILLTEPGAYLSAGSCEENTCPEDPDNPPSYNDYAIGIAGTLHLVEDSAYAIVDVSKAAGPTYTLAHELGHLQGLQHHPDDIEDPDPLYSYGFAHRTSNRATIMAAYDSGYPYIKHFSSPCKTYGGEALGIVNERHNTRVLNNTRYIVSNFEDANEPNAGILYTAGDTHQYGQNFTFDDNTCGGSGSLSYQWRKSYGDPYSFGNVESTSSSWFVALSPGTWYIKLTVNTSSGQSSSRVIFVQAQEQEGCQGCVPGSDPQPKIPGSGTEDEGRHPEALALLPAYPNPFNPTTQITFDLPETRHVTLTVYDMVGREAAALADQPFSAGRHRVSFNAAGLSSGRYFVRMQAGEYVQTQTITLVK